VTAGRYAEGVLLGIVCLGALGLGAHRLRLRLAPFYDGATARIADGVSAVALLIVVLEATGVIGVLDRVGVVAGCLLAGALAWAIGARGVPRRQAERTPADGVAARRASASPHRRLVLSVAIAATCVVAAVWFGWTIYAYGHGMETIDTLWYHMPFAARFVQLHNIRHLQYFDNAPVTAFYPANSELIHAFGIVLFGTDLLSPAIDLCWAAAGLSCAWAIGRPWGREPHCVLACLPVLATPGIVDTQPGGAYDDIVCLTLLLASIALLVNARPGVTTQRIPLGASVLAAAAAGLALGTKFTMIGPAILLGLGSAVILGRGQRWRHAGAWAGGLLLLGGYWYLRNAIAVGNPLPSLSLHLGPLALPSPKQPAAYTVWEYLRKGIIWRKIFIPGLRESLGLAWWALLLGGITGAVLGLFTPRDPRTRLIGAIALVSGFLFLVTPQLLGLPGDPIFFFANVRYALLPLTLGLILLALSPRLGRRRWSLAWLGANAMALVATVLDPGVWKSGIPVKQFAPEIHGGSALTGAVLAAVLLIAGELWLWLGPRLNERANVITRRRRVRLVPFAATAATVLAVGGGWLVSDSYAHDRYRDSSPLPTLYAWARHVHHARIGIVGFNEQYPFTGPGDSNYVQYIGVGQPHRGFAAAANCPQWRTAINRGRYRFVVVTPVFFAPVQQAPELRWTQASPNAHAIVRQADGDSELGVVFRITGPLDPSTCPPGHP
jgi:hypothetical protein